MPNKQIALISILALLFSFVSANETNSKDSIFIQSDTTIRILESGAVINKNSPSIPIKDTVLLPVDEIYDVDELDRKLHENLQNNRYFETDRDILNIYGFPYDSIPKYDDQTIEARLSELNVYTPFELTFNKHIRNHINVYVKKNRGLSERVLGLSHIYFPYFESVLDKYDMPLELKYLAVVESALNPTATSHAGAKGLWQFMYLTGKAYGLDVNSIIDERNDPILSTEAACRHLKDLYNYYDSWSMALAAYNSGSGNVNKALRKAGGTKNYWAIWPFLPRETRGYVPAFIAVNYLFNFAAEHNLYPIKPDEYDIIYDTVIVRDVLSFDQLNEMLQIPLTDLQFLNPEYKKGIIPASEKQYFKLKLPVQYVGQFIDFEQSLYDYVTIEGLGKEKMLEEIEKAKNRNIHRVRSGENLGSIAQKYGCSVKKLKSWNGLRRNTIYPGQKLVVFSKNRKSKTSSKPATKKTYKSTQSCQFEYYVIQSGDTLWDIANKFNGVSVDKIKQLNNISNSHKLKPGQRIKLKSI